VNNVRYWGIAVAVRKQVTNQQKPARAGVTFGLAVVFGSFAQFCKGMWKYLPKFVDLG
jgi:hypothetical protein